MGTRLTVLQANVRFWLWKARNMHAARYVALFTIMVMLVGVGIYSGGQLLRKPNVAVAASGAVLNNGTLQIDGAGYSYLLQTDTANCGANKASLWPLNYASSILMSNNGQSSYRGLLCLTPSATTLTVTNGGELSLVGAITFSSVTINGAGSKISTAPADANGMAAPYQARPDFWSERLSGFIKLDAPSGLGISYAYYFKPDVVDDSVVIEFGTTPGDVTSIDDPTNPINVVSWNKLGVCSLDPSFYQNTQNCNGKAGTIAVAPDVEWRQDVAGVSGGTSYYLPIRINHAEATNGASMRINMRVVKTENNNSQQLSNGPLQISWLFAPLKTSANVGKVDTTAGGRMRYEYGDAGPSTTAYTARDMSNATHYYFDPSIDLSQTGSLSGFGKANNSNYDFSLADPNATTAGSPLNNTQRQDGAGYRIGAVPNNNGQPALLQNYRLQTHDAGNSSGFAAGLNLSTTGDMVLQAGAMVDGVGRGLPGATRFSEGFNQVGISGVGGSSGPNSSVPNHKPGWFQPVGTVCSVITGSDFDAATGNAGAGAGAGKDVGPGSGGGGGGFGYGSGGRVVLDSDKDAPAGGKGVCYGGGGAGYGGVGAVSVRNDGTSDWSGYTYTAIAGMGGGGATGSEGDGFNLNQAEAGSGGALVKLTIGGNLTLAGSTVDASGNAPANTIYGIGGGGGGSADIHVTGGITVDATSFIKANGGATVHQPDQYPNAGQHMKGGEGGGGLVRIGAGSFNGAGIPTTYVCQDRGNVFKPSLGNLSVAAGGGAANVRAQNGLIDLFYIGSGVVYCGTSANGTNVAISKQIQQYAVSGTPAAADVTNDAEWSNVSTVVPTMFIRGVITIHNPASVPKTITIADSLPITTMTFAPANVYLRNVTAPGSPPSPASVGVSGNSFSVASIVVPADTTYQVLYSAAVTNPF